MDGLGEGPGLDPGLQLRMETRGSRATLGLRPWMESSRVWYFRLEMKMCCSWGGRAWKSMRSWETSTSSGRQKKESCFDQPLEDVVLLLIITGHVDRLAEEHRLLELIVLGLAKVE